MNVHYVILFFLLIAGANVNAKQSEFAKSYQQIEQELDGKIKRCRQQYDNVIKKAYTESKKPIRAEEYVEFIKNEKKALQNLEAFDLAKLTDIDEQRFYDLISDQCSKEHLITFKKLEKKRKSCNYLFEEWKYMKALIYAQKNNNWTEATKQKAKQKVLAYVERLADPKFYLSKLLALDLMTAMVGYGLVDQKFKEEIGQTQKRAVKHHEDIKQTLKAKQHTNDKTDYYSCDGFRIHKELETPFAQSFSTEITALLKKIGN